MSNVSKFEARLACQRSKSVDSAEWILSSMQGYGEACMS
jgi:hypothetical protein